MRKDCIWKWEDAWGSIAWSRRSEARLVLEHKGWVSGNGGNEAMVGRSQILNNCIKNQLHMPYLATADHSLCLETPSPWLPGYHSLLVSLLPYSGHSSVLFLTFAFYTTYKCQHFSGPSTGAFFLTLHTPLGDLVFSLGSHYCLHADDIQTWALTLSPLSLLHLHLDILQVSSLPCLKPNSTFLPLKLAPPSFLF